MKKLLSLFALLFLIVSCKAPVAILTTNKQQINITLDSWHKAAAKADYPTYFNLMTSNGVFIGTDPTENWQNEAFKVFAKPYFDKGKAWDFTPLERNIYLSPDQKTAWFDELLDTQMKICRGSGVLQKQNGEWKIAHYVLSITIPNENTTEVVKLKTNFDSIIIKKLNSSKKD